ncbi:uncharacterized protein [Parasteatoda tepidariorum]|uniref:uncharacterized protein n=1 Tax=Parasteatoda tepidariorum TaxID=114398 RepID=UPI0039BC9DE2
MFTHNNEIRVGCAFVVYQEGIQIDRCTFRLCEKSTVFKAELWAILQAIYYINKNNINERVNIFSDSLSSLQALEKPGHNDHTVTMVKKHHKHNIGLSWIKAHDGKYGNEEADKWAKYACQMARIDTYNCLSRNIERQRQRETTIIEWQRRWDNDREQGRHTHGLIGRVNPTALNSNFYLNQFLTDHGTQRTYQARFHQKDPNCTSCLTNDDLEHILTKCPNFQTQRVSFFPDKLSYGFLRQHWRNDKIKQGIIEIIKTHFENNTPELSAR